MGDYTETTEVDFDPARISYEKLLLAFWSFHSPRAGAARQYKSAVWCNSPAQEKAAREVKARLEKQRGGELYTEVLPASRFYLSEDYHQKYYLKAHRVLEHEFERIYPRAEDYLASTAVARANSVAGGDMDPAQLQREIGQYGLSEQGQQALLKLAQGGHPIKCAY